jgi:peptidoglycan/xylan/chitin deacetylase (PgdA/CDA1 family)
MFQVGPHSGQPYGHHLFMLRHALAPVLPRAAHDLRIARTLPPRAGTVALTFDDGPHPEGTPAVLDLLARAGHTATFFLIGEQVDRRPELAREIVRQGHLVAVHGYRHRLQMRLRADELGRDMERALSTIHAATGIRPAHHRPPYGVYSPAGLALTTGLGLKPLLWSRWGKDWRRFTTPTRIASRATRNLGPGDVILLHDADYYSARNSHRRTVEALRLIISELQRLEIGTVLPA